MKVHGEEFAKLIKWVASVTDKKSNTTYYTRIHCDGVSQWIGTDGLRIHEMTYTKNLKAGAYKVVKLLKMKVELELDDEVTAKLPDRGWSISDYKEDKTLGLQRLESSLFSTVTRSMSTICFYTT